MSSLSADAGAWTLKEHHWQVFTGMTTSQSSMMFDRHGQANLRTTFNKSLLQNCLEYGLADTVTIFATPAFAVARVQTPTTMPVSARNSSIEAGVRILLSNQIGQLSLQSSYKSAGAFDLSVSINHKSGRQIELRLLYGSNFGLFGRNGFVDIQIGQRWIGHPRPNETPIDLTAGLWLTRSTMLMAQSFNIISAGDSIAPYSYYRAHKLELSVVEKLSRHWSLQMGAFISPAGQNALVERGVIASLWTQD
jgi:protein XagA